MTFRTAPPTHRKPLGRLAPAIVLALMAAFALGGLAGMATARAGDEAWLDEAIGVPAPRTGDRGYYTLATLEADGAVARRLIAFEWGTPETVLDPAGATHHVNVLSTQFLSPDGRPESLDEDASRLLPNADRLLDATDGRLVAVRARSETKVTWGVTWYGTFHYDYPLSYRHDRVTFATSDSVPQGALCGLRHSLQGIAHALKDYRVVLENCELFGSRVARAEFRAEDSVRVDGRSATAFTASVPGGTARFWLDRDLPYPIRWELDAVSGPDRVLTLDGFEAGDRGLLRRLETPVAFAPAALPLVPRNFTGPDASGIDHPFPLWRAWAEAQESEDPDLDGFLADHPDAYMEAALYYEEHYNETSAGGAVRTLVREWFMGLTDGHDRIYVELRREVEDREGTGALGSGGPLGPGHRESSSLWVHGDLDCDPMSAFHCPHLPGYEKSRPLSPALAPTSYPSVSALHAAFASARPGERPNGWAFCVPCSDGVQPLLAAATYYHAEGDFQDPVFEGLHRASWRNEIASLWTDAGARPVMAASYAESYEPVDPTLDGPLGAPPVAGSQDVGIASVATSPARWALPPPSAAVAVVATASLVGLLYWLWPFVKSGAWSLFTRLESPRLLAHPTRAAIHAYVGGHPGATFTDIQKGLGLPTGVAQHHLDHLLRGGLLHDRRGPKHRIFYVAGGTDRRLMDAGTALAEEAPRRILDLVAAHPGVTPGALAQRAGITRQTAHYHIRRLKAAGLVVVERSGWKSAVVVSDLGRKALAAS